MSAVARLKLLRADTVAETASWLKTEEVPLVAAALRHSVPLDEADGLRVAKSHC